MAFPARNTLLAARVLILALFSLLIMVVALLGATHVVYAQDAIVEEYYVPLPEDDLFDSFNVINANANGIVTGTVSISIGGDTIIYYDQVENGYETDISNPTNLYSSGGGGCAPANLGGTQIWGNNNLCDGIPPGIGAVDLLTNGKVIVLKSGVVVPRNFSTLYFDGGDKFAATYRVGVTRTGFPSTPGSLMAGGVEVFNSNQWSTEYQSPVGQDAASNTGAWDYSVLFVMATKDGTQVYHSVGGLQGTINEGENLVVPVNAGDMITTTHPVQVDLVTGEPSSQYEMRWDGLLPRKDWSNEYFMPVGSIIFEGEGETAVWFFNPNAFAITVAWEIGPSTTGSINVPAGDAVFGPYIGGATGTEGARFYSVGNQTFYTLAQVDADTDTESPGNAYDWGFPLIPSKKLSPQLLVGYAVSCTTPGAPGCTTSTSATVNRSPVWLMPVAETDVYVDYQGGLPVCPAAGTVDATIHLTARQIAHVYDPNDFDMTGARIWTCSGVKIASAWGQDPDSSTSVGGSTQELDLGTVVVPLPTIQLEKYVSVANDNDADGAISPGDVITYTVVIVNNSAYPAEVNISDTLPANVTYLANSTRYLNTTSTTPIPDSGTTPFPLDEGGVSLIGGNPITVGPGEVHSVKYRVRINEFIGACKQSLVNSAHVVATIDQTAETVEDEVDEITVLACTPAVSIRKFTNGDDANAPTGPIVPVGATVTWVYSVTNIGDLTLSLIDLTDNIEEINSGNCTIPATLAPGATFTCSLNGTATLGQYANTATVTATAGPQENPPTTPTVVTDDDPSHYIGVLPTIVVTKTVNPTEINGSGGVATYTVSVQNSGQVTVSLESLIDLPFGDLTTTGNISSTTCLLPQYLDVAEVYTCNFSAFVTGSENAPHDNVVTATAYDAGGNPATDDDPATVTFDELPEIETTKTGNPTALPSTSGAVAFTVVVENVGPVSVTLVSLIDSDFGDLNGKGTCAIGATLAVGGSYSCAFTETVSGTEALPHNNVVTAIARDKDGNEDSDDDDETVTFDELPEIETTKTGNPTAVKGSSGPVNFTVVVHNIGPVSVTLTALTDSVFGNLNGKGTCALGTTIAIGGSYTCSFTETISGSETLPHNNVVTATVRDKDGNEDDDDDDETVPFDELPEIQTTKTGNPTLIVGTSGPVNFTVVVENIGPVSVTLISLIDSDFGNLNGKGTCVTGGTIAVGGSYSCSFTETVTGSEALPHNNIVTAVARDKDGNEDSDDDDETVTFDELPQIETTKTGNPKVIAGPTGLVTFTVVVENVGPVAVTLTSLVDSDFGNLNGRGTCAIGGTIAIGGSYTCTFTATVNGSKTLPHNNIVTAIARDKDNHQDEDDDDETVTFEELPATIGDKVWIDENRNGLQDADEVGLAGVNVDLYTSSGAFVGTDTTDGNGIYLFTGLPAGSYYVEFATPQGYIFTRYDVNSNSQDGTDSDALVPQVAIGVTDEGNEGEFGENVTYIVSYTNNDATRQATNVVITTTVPLGTSFVVTESSPSWSCTSVAEGGLCTFSAPTLAPNTSGTLLFVVRLQEIGSDVPDPLDLEVNLTHVTLARTLTFALAEGEVNRSLDAGLLRAVVLEQTPTPTDPTNLPEGEQPQQQLSTFLPSVEATK